jgi:flagellar hook protein FlgE
MSFDIALSGIQAINHQLEVTSNNIANAGTYGFKSSRANFAAMYSGTQATGVEVGSMTQSIGLAGGTETTGRGLDAAIDGRGFFVSRDSSGVTSYSRVGIFQASKDGYLIDSNRRFVQGYAPIPGSTTLGVMGDIKIPTGQIPAVASTRLDYVGNLSADWTVPTVVPFDMTAPKSYNMTKQSIVYDSLGSEHTVSQYFVKTGPNTVTVHYSFDNSVPVAADDTTLSFSAQGQLPAIPAPVKALTMTPTNGSAPIAFTLDYTGTTQFAGDTVTTTNQPNGNSAGMYIGVELAADGSVVAKYSNEQKQTVGTLALATFPDEDSLNPTADTSWEASSGSGAALYGVAGVGMAGKINNGRLERSNVDITAELVGLMTSQRNYQANSKVISTENAMMQALMQAL